METFFNWIDNFELDKIQNYVSSMKDINSILIYDDDTNLSLLHIISGYCSLNRDKILYYLFKENLKSFNKPKININLKSGIGNDYWTAAHIAACWGHEKTLEFLIENGADIKLNDKNGNTVIDIARAYDQFRCVSLLREKLESTSYLKDEFNKTCETIFYSFNDTKQVSSDCKKLNAQTQTSFENYKNCLEKSLFNSDSKALASNRHYFDLKNTQKENSTFIKSFMENSYLKTEKYDKIKKDLFHEILNDSKKMDSKKKDFSSKTLNLNIDEELSLLTEDNLSLGSSFTDNTISTISIDKNKELYVDNEFGISFLNETINSSLNSKDDDLNKTLILGTNVCDYTVLSDNQLRESLKEHGLNVGPITPTTKNIYLKKLKELENLKENDSTKKNSDFKISDSSMFNKPIKELILNQFNFNQAIKLEKEFMKKFDDISGSKQYFNYLLLDPRIGLNLNKDNNEFDASSFERFIKSIFYIGKGQGNRPYMHLYEASILCKNKSSDKKKSNNKKLDRILDIWNSNHGVISLHSFNGITSIEALTRECFMIDAIGIKNLTNVQIGQNHVKNLLWNDYKKQNFGSFLLYKAYQILLINGERQIKQADV